MIDVAEELRPEQIRLLDCLLACPTIQEAAEQAGIPYGTARRWIGSDPKFRAAYNQARRQLVEHAIVKLQKATDQAVDTLISIATGRRGRPNPTRLAAAKMILDLSLRAVELEDLQQRVSELEEQLAMVARSNLRAA